MIVPTEVVNQILISVINMKIGFSVIGISPNEDVIVEFCNKLIEESGLYNQYDKQEIIDTIIKLELPVSSMIDTCIEEFENQVVKEVDTCEKETKKSNNFAGKLMKF